MISTKHPAGGDEQGSLEGFQVDINEQKRRADFVFCRPPFNIIPHATTRSAALACDFRTCAKPALYALPEQKLGRIPGFDASARLC